MPPRKRSKKAGSDSEESEAPSSEFEPSESGSSGGAAGDDAPSSDDGVAKLKKPAAVKKAAAPAARKRAAPAAKATDGAGDEGGGDDEDKPKKKRAPAKKKGFQPAAGDLWSYKTADGTLIYRSFGDPKPSKKIAGFDMDGTLINVKSGARFAKDDSDWKLFNKKVVGEVQKLAEAGYKVVIFSNQNGIKGALGGKMAEKVKSIAAQLVETLGVPAQVFLAPQKDCYRKPESGMWEYFTASCNGGVEPDLTQSFYCGDAAGRSGDASAEADFADSDKRFASNIGVDFKLPEDVFGPMEGKKATSAAAKSAGMAALESGSSPNQALVQALKDYADQCFEQAKETGEDKYRWKAIGMKKAVGSLVTFPDVISLDNIKEVAKLQGVGKGTVDKIKEYIATGRVALGDAPSDPAEAAKKEAKAKAGSARQEAAMAFL